MADARIVVVTHKPYWMPEDPVYLPVQVGFGEDLGFVRDNTGENIAEKNASFCELTALYWAWKNLDADAIGLVHYRRHFAEKRRSGDTRVLTGRSVDTLLSRHDLILPKPRHYWIETNWSHYAHAHHEKDLVLLRETIEVLAPAYLEAFDRVMKRTWGHRFNMFVMKHALLDSYCTWSFDILFAVEKKLDISGYTPYDKRVYGFLSERLLDVWILENGVTYHEIPCLYMESVHWPLKILNFLKRKVGRSYAHCRHSRDV
ncbi:DUF4422 domain-containing protein [Eubacteriales bacterium OttesenSCG-928-A19]|nr:DUF4422 domain-containing protein [Eubacteriales bacterium OttesenSCG-928-A19]